MTELLLYMNNYSITGVITAYQTYLRCQSQAKMPRTNNIQIPQEVNIFTN